MAPTEDSNCSPLQTPKHFLPRNLNHQLEDPFWNVNTENEVNIADNDELVVSEPINPYAENFQIPLLPNLRQLLITESGSDNLENVTEVKLKVISQEVGLQHLNLHLPALRELTLDGSAISSLRDLGSGLKMLKVLKVNRCGLTSLDGIYGVENLEKLYAACNSITDLTACSFLELIKCIDVKRNKLKDVNVLSYLSVCDNLENLILEDNINLVCTITYREDVKRILPNLKSLDGVEFTEGEYPPLPDQSLKYKEVVTTKNPNQRLPKLHINKLPPLAVKSSPKASPILSPAGASSSSSSAVTSEQQCSYTVSFTPKVLTPRENQENVIIKQQADIKVEKVELPKI